MSEEMKSVINFEQFSAIDLRVGRVIEATEHPNADKLLVLKVDLGEDIGVRQVLAGIKGFYTPEEVVGKSIVVVVNLAPRVMRGLESQGMLLAAVVGQPAESLALLTVDREMPAGTRVS